MPNIFTKVISYFTGKMRNYDQFAIPITLNYNGEDSFKSYLGGFFSIIAMILTFIYGLTLLIALFNYSNTVINTVELIRNLATDTTTYKINNDAFAIGVYGTNTNGDLLYDPSYVTVTAFHVTQRLSSVGGSVISQTQTQLTVTTCNNRFYEAVGESLATSLGTSQFYCISENQYCYWWKFRFD